MSTKYFTTAILLLAFVAFGYGQTSEHLSFKGVPIDGTLEAYVSKMINSGFSHVTTTAGTAILNGDFAGFKGCQVVVSTLKQKDLVYNITVIFSKKNAWSTLSGNYFELKNLLTEKYGNASVVVERFDGSYQPDDDDTKMIFVTLDNCKYYAIWTTDKGDIQLSIVHDNILESLVELAYLDKINGNIIKANAKDDL